MKKNTKIRKQNMMGKNTSKPVDIAIDFEDWIYYSSEHINKFSKFVSISRLESGKKRILLQLPHEPDIKQSEILTQLLRFALKRYKIKRVFVDRYFFCSDAIKVFQRLHLEYWVPCPRIIPSIKEIFDHMQAPCMIKDLRLKDTRFNLVITKYKYEGSNIKRAYATNADIDEKDIDSINKIFSYNRKELEINVYSESVRNSKITTKSLKLLSSTFNILHQERIGKAMKV